MCAKTHSYNVTHVYKNLVTWPPRTHHHSPPITLHFTKILDDLNERNHEFQV